MNELKGNVKECIGFLFDGMEDTVILSCIEGHMGRIWVDNYEKPTCGVLLCGSFMFIGGTNIDDTIINYTNKILLESNKDCLFIISNIDGIDSYLESYYGEKYKKIKRYALHKKRDEFDLLKLQGIANSLPTNFSIYPINEKWYHECLKEEWSRDFVDNFKSVEDFIDRGVGYVIIHNEKIVSGASSYSIYNDGIEIEIATRFEYRQKGLALIVGAALILECGKRDLYPSWDAANMISVCLANKLGYEYKGEYNTYCIQK